MDSSLFHAHLARLMLCRIIWHKATWARRWNILVGGIILSLALSNLHHPAYAIGGLCAFAFLVFAHRQVAKIILFVEGNYSYELMVLPIAEAREILRDSLEENYEHRD